MWKVMTVLGWVFVWFGLPDGKQVVKPEHWEGGESDMAGSTLIGLIVTWVEWQIISPLWSWPGIIFCWYFHDQSLSLTKEHRAAVHILPAGCSATFAGSWSSVHTLCCQQHLLTITALDSLPRSYYLGETQEYEAKKRKRVSSAEHKRLRLFWLLWQRNALIVLWKAQTEIPRARSHLYNLNVWKLSSSSFSSSFISLLYCPPPHPLWFFFVIFLALYSPGI